MKSRDKVKNSGKNILYLIKNTVVIVGNNPDIVKPLIRSCTMAIVNILILFSSIAMLIGGNPYGILVLLFYVLIFHPFTFFYHTRMRACSSWIAFKTLTKEKVSFSEAKKHTKQQKGALRIISIIDIIISSAKNDDNDKNNSPLRNMLSTLVDEGWDLVKFFSIPTVVIENLSFKNAVKKIKKLKNNIPETLAGVFGIDLFSGVFSKIFGIIYIPIILLFLAIAYFGHSLFPESSNINLGPIIGDSFDGKFISWYPLVFGFFISSLISRCVTHVISTFKILYFTIFYTAVNYNDKVDESMRGYLTSYLNLDDVTELSKDGFEAYKKFIS